MYISQNPFHFLKNNHNFFSISYFMIKGTYTYCLPCPCLNSVNGGKYI